MATYEYDSVIAYEDRAKCYTHDWRFTGVNTLSTGNTDGGMLYFSLTLSGSTYTVDVYKAEAKASGDKVATGTTTTTPNETTPPEVTLAAANSSGLSGAVKLADYTSDETGGYLWVIYSVDADVQRWFDGYTRLNNYSTTLGLAAYHNLAAFEIIDRLTTRMGHELGGHGKSPWWQAGSKQYPDLRRILNPEQLRKASIFYALYAALSGSSLHQDSTYMELRDHFKSEFNEAINAVQLAIDSNADGDGDVIGSLGSVRWERA